MSQPPQSQNSNMGVYIALGVVVILVIVGGFVFAMNNNNSSSSNKSSSSSSSSSSKSADAMMNKSDTSVMVGGAAMFANKNIIDNVVNAPNLTTLVAAVKAGDLVTTLQGAGPFTVFGPNNDAFAALPAGTVETLVKPENKATLVDILTYHVVSGKFTIADLKDGQMLKTVQGGQLKVTKTNGTTLINGIAIETPDVLQSNGVAHVIKGVLMPSQSTTMVGGAAMLASKNIVENVVNAPNLSTLVAAVTAADLVTTLQGTGPFTVFGPDNNAFNKLPAGTVETLVKPESKATLTNILTHHVVSGKYTISSLKDGQKLKTVQGEEVTIMKSGDKVMIKDAKGGTSTIITPDVLQSNGVAHVIDTVLMPSK